jgi:pSer/pThr/pTyr-binding forkhead associated (FHA) protein
MIAIDIPRRGRVEASYVLRMGREEAWADVRLEYAGISRHHLEIRADGEGYRLFDMGSSNGTTVNGKAVGQGGRFLVEGDVISVAGEVDLQVLEITPPPQAKRTRARDTLPNLAVELQDNVFMVSYRADGQTLVRDTMPFQLGLALSVLVLYQRDGLGPVSDTDMRSLVWRGDPKQQASGDINRLLLRMRKWFRDRGGDPPPIERRKGTFTTQLASRSLALVVKPDAWLYRFLDEA